MRTAIISNVNLDMLIQSLRKRYEVFNSDGYGQWVNYAIDERSALKEFNPQCIFVWLDGIALLESCNSFKDGMAELQHATGYIKKIAELYSDVLIFVTKIDIKPKIINTADSEVLSDKWEYEWDDALGKVINNHKNLHYFDIRNLIREYGSKNIYSDKMWYMCSMPYSLQGIKVFESEIISYINKLNIVRKKLLILDLDNTLWGGVVGEDGVTGITLGNSLVGAIYRDTQKSIKELAKTGVLLAVVSKNNFEDVKEVFDQNPNMVLKQNDFAYICANWEPKHENIKHIANELNLGLDSFVFLDDNKVEQETVKINLPDVTVHDFPTDISKLPQTINDIYQLYFWQWRNTDEDIYRTQRYQQEIFRKQELKSYISIDEYLLSLNIQIEFGEMREKNIERVIQLINKTNQFNTCTLRFDRAQLNEYWNKDQHFIFVANVSDKYGDEGLVSVVMVHYECDTAFIDNFVMSCRVMGKQIENAIINSLEKKFYENGIKMICAKYIRSTKNKPVERLWDKLGYDLSYEDNGIKQYIFYPGSKVNESLLIVNWR